MATRFTPRIGNARISGATERYVADDTRVARQNMGDIIENYKGFIKHIEDLSPEILMEALIPAFALSKVYCPKDSGALVNSAYLSKTTFRGVPTVEIGYAKGGNPPYAAIVHESLDFAHTAPTRAKFLEAALRENETSIQSTILKRYKEMTGD